MMNKKRIGLYLKQLRSQKKRKDGKSFSQYDLAEEFSIYSSNWFRRREANLYLISPTIWFWFM